MKTIIKTILLYTVISGLWGCEKNKVFDETILFPTDMLFEEFDLGRFKHEIPSSSFKNSIATFNVSHQGSDWAGFALSNRNHRKYVSDISHLDSTQFSVYTNTPHAGGNFLVAKTSDEQAYVTFDRPIQVNKVLVANTTQVWQTISRGPGNATLGYTYSPGTRVLSIAQNDYVKIIATGYLNNQPTGEISFLLADRRSDDTQRNFTITDWMPMNLSSLGKIDKLLFQLDSSDKTGDVMNTPPYFCLDGFQFDEHIQ